MNTSKTAALLTIILTAAGICARGLFTAPHACAGGKCEAVNKTEGKKSAFGGGLYPLHGQPDWGDAINLQVAERQALERCGKHFNEQAAAVHDKLMKEYENFDELCQRLGGTDCIAFIDRYAIGAEQRACAIKVKGPLKLVLPAVFLQLVNLGLLRPESNPMAALADGRVHLELDLRCGAPSAPGGAPPNAAAAVGNPAGRLTEGAAAISELDSRVENLLHAEWGAGGATR